jgi:DNA-binding LacI/PurR family transcriptional regulator
MAETDAVKHEAIQQKLMNLIRAKKIKGGGRLPSERGLAREFGVSYMTVRRAVGELVEAHLVERRAREGIFVRSGTHERLMNTTLNLIYTSEGILASSFLRLGCRFATALGWQPHVIRLNGMNDREAIRAILGSGLSIVSPDEWVLTGPIGDAMQQANGRAVVWGNRLDGLGVPSVVGNAAQEMMIAVRRLEAAGHKRIALIVDRPEHPVTEVHVDAWRHHLTVAGLTADQLERDLVTVNSPRFEDVTARSVQVVRNYFADGGEATGIIAGSIELGMVALAAAREANRPAPTPTGVVALGDAALASLTFPALTCVDADLDRHFEVAVEMLQYALDEGRPPAERLRVVPPRLIERASVA